MTRNNYIILTSAILIFGTTACTKDAGKANGTGSSMVLTSIISKKYNDSVNIEYDDQNRPAIIRNKMVATWVSKYDTKNYVAEIRDTGVSSGGFVGIPIDVKYTFEHDNQGRITRVDYYDFLLVADTSHALTYTIFTYYTDSVVNQTWIYDPTTGAYNTGTDKIHVRYINTGNNLNYETISTVSGYPDTLVVSATYSDTYKNPLAMLPVELANYSSALFVAYYDTWFLMLDSKNIVETATQDQRYYSDYFKSDVISQQTYSTSGIINDQVSEYPATMTQITHSKFTVRSTGAVTTSDEQNIVEFDYAQQ